MLNSLRNTTSSRFTVAFRLLRADGFGHVIRAKYAADSHFKIFFASNCAGNARLGIITSKKILSNATDRNRIKRIIRETFRQHEIKDSKLDLVVMLKQGFSIGQSVRVDELKTLLSRVKENAQNCN